jgi:hypothetical protein
MTTDIPNRPGLPDKSWVGLGGRLISLISLTLVVKNINLAWLPSCFSASIRMAALNVPLTFGRATRMH